MGSSEKNVLVIDDATTVRAYHRQLIEQLGATVYEAENGMEAIELAHKYPFQLFVVDINMPVMDGYRFLTEARTYPDLQNVPALMVTTESQTKDSERAYDAGANLFLTKPVKPNIFKDYVNMLLG